MKQFSINKSFFILTLFFACIFISCKTTKLSEDDFVSYEYISEFYPEQIEWTALNDEGFWQTNYDIKSIGVTWHCVKIDLNADNLEIVFEPKTENLGQIFRLKKFAKENNTIVAINTTPFDLKGKTYIPVGITKYKDEYITNSHERYCALSFEYNEENKLRAKIVDSQADEEFKNSEFAIGGFFTILDGDKIYEFTKIRRSRSGCGISDDGRYLYLFVTTPHFALRDRNGLNYEECAVIMKQLGCNKAMQFDGGHSSGLCIYSELVEEPFLQRKVPVAFGFKIK